jgi:hypothetical protein
MDSQQMMEFLLAWWEDMKAILDENTKTIQEILLAMQEDSKAGREETMHQEHQEVPNQYAVVKPVRGRKRRHRGRKQAATW